MWRLLQLKAAQAVMAILAIAPGTVADGPKEILMRFTPPIEYECSGDADCEAAMTDPEKYIPENNIPTGLKVYKNTIFLQNPRWVPGVFAALTTVEAKKYEIGTQPKLKPWPDYSWQNPEDCDTGLAFVMSVEVDPKGRMWVIDTGNQNLYEGTPKFFCPASVLVFDIDSKELLTRFHLPPEIAHPESNFLNDIVVDPKSDWAYISDNDGMWEEGRGGVVAVQPFKKIATRLKGPSTDPKLRATAYIMGGVRYFSMNPVNSISLDPRGEYVYYAPNTGFNVNMVSTAVMQDTTKTPAEREAESMLVGQKPTPTSSMMWASNGTMFFAGLTMDALLAWTWGVGLLDSTWWIAYQDHENMQFLDQLDFDERGFDTPNPQGSNLYWLTNQLFLWLNEREGWMVNIFKAAVDTSGYMDAIMDGEMTVTYVPTSIEGPVTFQTMAGNTRDCNWVARDTTRCTRKTASQESVASICPNECS